ncbi:Lipid A 3-O-deacylase-like protein [Catenovulum agarivorans DS-2]|uniref:Lipid A 3-O-deacylase-like protein n=1 Tax=Catenovulum agarivorans DS-2 TaxID=1328313 RepID=W7QPC3_9ALTE|nr:acyloxyacyl hydrolase [Catenovulum agarivorans]EWH10837.1 Lipid A 3-O-deacylase-like protein [Catenovulum agarivorans DS-2]
MHLFHLNQAKALFPAILFTLSATHVYSRDNQSAGQVISFEYMMGTADMQGARFGYRPNTSHQLDIPWLGQTQIEYELAVHLFDLHGSADNEASYGAAVTPIFIKNLGTVAGKPLQLEFAIGLAYVHDRQFGGVDIGSYYQFEDRIGLTMQLDPASDSHLGIRYMHYSNGGLNTKNPGLDFLNLFYMRRF